MRKPSLVDPLFLAVLAISTTALLAQPALASSSGGAQVADVQGCTTFPGFGTTCTRERVVLHLTETPSGNTNRSGTTTVTSSFVSEDPNGCTALSSGREQFHVLVEAGSDPQVLHVIDSTQSVFDCGPGLTTTCTAVLREQIVSDQTRFFVDTSNCTFS